MRPGDGADGRAGARRRSRSGAAGISSPRLRGGGQRARERRFPGEGAGAGAGAAAIGPRAPSAPARVRGGSPAGRGIFAGRRRRLDFDRLQVPWRHGSGVSTGAGGLDRRGAAGLAVFTRRGAATGVTASPVGRRPPGLLSPPRAEALGVSAYDALVGTFRPRCRACLPTNRAPRPLRSCSTRSHLDAVLLFQKRHHVLAREVEQLRDFVNPNCCQKYALRSFRLRRSTLFVLLRPQVPLHSAGSSTTAADSCGTAQTLRHATGRIPRRLGGGRLAVSFPTRLLRAPL